MATQSQIDANRINAQLSDGPTSSEGKARSSQNSFSHGLTAAKLFIADEDQEEYNQLVDGLHSQFQPANPDEQILLDNMIRNYWLSLRAVRLQAVAMNTSAPASLPKDLALLIRYQHASERGYYKARTELLKARKEKEKSQIGFVSQTAFEPAETTPASIFEVCAPPDMPVSPTPNLADLDDFEREAEATLTGDELTMAKAWLAELRAHHQAA